MGRAARWFAVLASLALLTASCGDDDDDGGDGANPATDVDLSGESLEVAAVWTDAEEERFTQVLQAFEDETGADITYTSTGDSMDVFLDGRIAREGPPDVAIVAQPALLRQLAADGNLTALGDDARSVVEESFDEGLIEAMSVDGELYGVPFKTANKSLLWYNLTVLDDAGVEPPASWDDLQTEAQTVEDSGVAAISLGADVGWPLTDWFENVLLLTAGGDFYDQLAAGEAEWDSPEVRTALETLAEVWQDQWIAGGLGGAAATGFDESATKLVTEPTGFLFEGDFVAGVISGEEAGEIGTDFDFVPFPAIGDGEAGDQVILGGDFPVLLQDSEAGQALMAFLATAEAQEIWASEGGFLSSNTDVDSDVYPDDVTRRAAEMIQEASGTRFDLSDQVPPEFGATEGQGLWKIFTDFLQDPSKVDETVAALSSAAPSAG